jgi:predicted aspartyl protease
MKTLLRGEIVNFVPYFKADIRKNGLTLRNDGSISLTVDTGFSGGIALRENVLNKMKLEFIGFDTFTIATGEVVELPMYIGKVFIKNREVETWFIPGDSLIGMEFLSIAGKVLNVNFEKSNT